VNLSLKDKKGFKSINENIFNTEAQILLPTHLLSLLCEFIFER